MLAYLQEARELLADMRWDSQGNAQSATRAAQTEFNRRLHHLRSVVRPLVPGLESSLTNATSRSITLNRRTLDQAIYALEDGAEVMRRIGPPPGPTLRADTLHATVWDAAKSFWRSNHRTAAVGAAASAVNAMLQDRAGRRDVSNTTLVEQAFSLDAPKPGAPRLRVRKDDGSETYRSAQVGAMRFGAGCFMALRNPTAHEADEIDEQDALEQLAAFSVLARWVERAEIIAVP